MLNRLDLAFSFVDCHSLSTLTASKFNCFVLSPRSSKYASWDQQPTWLCLNRSPRPHTNIRPSNLRIRFCIPRWISPINDLLSYYFSNTQLKTFYPSPWTLYLLPPPSFFGWASFTLHLLPCTIHPFPHSPLPFFHSPFSLYLVPFTSQTNLHLTQYNYLQKTA